MRRKTGRQRKHEPVNSHTTTSDYACLDRPEVLAFLFHPRPDPGASGAPAPEAQARVPGTTDVLIPVADAALVGARLHLADPAAPSILFFHGNGEIVARLENCTGSADRSTRIIWVL